MHAEYLISRKITNLDPADRNVRYGRRFSSVGGIWATRLCVSSSLGELSSASGETIDEFGECFRLVP